MDVDVLIYVSLPTKVPSTWSQIAVYSKQVVFWVYI